MDLIYSGSSTATRLGRRERGKFFGWFGSNSERRADVRRKGLRLYLKMNLDP
ncbi:MAG: hypothetical protein WB763_02290 [Terriglobia bacterium]|jgi:hypothetical protein